MKKIDEIMDKYEKSMNAILLLNAANVATKAGNDTESDFSKNYQEAVDSKKRAVNRTVETYANQFARGGTYCPDSENLGKAKMVYWLKDLNSDTREKIENVLLDAEGKNPRDIAKELMEVLDENSAYRIARTETEKIRTTTKLNIMRNNGVKYVRYVAVMDDRTRPEHAALNGEIFNIDDAPILGEPNCRCTYTQVTELEAENANIKSSEEVQNWLKSEDGKAKGFEKVFENVKNVEEKRNLFENAFKTLKNEALREEFFKIAGSYVPDWCKVSIKELVKLPQDLLTPYKIAQEAANEVFTDSPIFIVDSSKWNEADLNYLKHDINLAKNGIVNDFPIMKNFVTGIDPDTIVAKNGIAIADFDPVFHKIRVNVHAGKRENLNENMEKIQKISIKVGKNVLTRDLPTNAAGIEFSLQHELGHAVQNHYDNFMRNSGRKNEFWKYFSEKFPNYKVKLSKNNLPDTKFIFENTPSVYGSSNTEEFISECFAEYYAKGKSASQISKDIVETYMELFKNNRANMEVSLLFSKKGSNKALHDYKFHFSNAEQPIAMKELMNYAIGQPADEKYVKIYKELLAKYE